MATNDDREDIIRDGRSLRTNPAEVGYRWNREAAAGAADADAQLSAARAAAYAWLRATLAALPAAVTSLSVGAVYEDPNDVPDLAPRLRADVVTPEITLRYPEDYPDDALECIDALDDGLREMTRPFLFALGDDEWLTVTRADIAPAFAEYHPDHATKRWPAPTFYGANPVPAMESVILAAITQELVDLPRGENTTIRVYRSAAGDLTWTVLAP